MSPSEAHILCGIEGCPLPHDDGPPMVAWGSEFRPCSKHREVISEVIREAWVAESVDDVFKSIAS